MKIFSKGLNVFIVSFLLSLLSNLAQAQLNTLSRVQNTLSDAEKVVNKTADFVNIINSAVDNVTNNQLYKSLIDGKEFKFPIGILPPSGDTKYALVINKVFMTPEGLFAEIFMKIPVSSDRSLYFLADKVPFSRTGGIAGDLRLYLLRTDSITFGSQKGYSVLFDGLEKGGVERSCFVTFNCKGFKDATLSGAVNLNKSSVVKDSKSKEQISLKYYIQADKLSNFIIQFKDVPSFEFTNLPGFKCTVKELTLDRSEVKNAPQFKLPVWYRDSIRTLLNNETLIVDGPEWEGLYVPEIDIEIPKAFKEDKPTEIVTVKSRDFIIDQNGVSGLNSAEDVLDGKIKGWSYSIDSLRINIIASSLSRGAIFGEMTLPICKEDSRVGIGLIITKNLSDKDLSYKGYIDIERNGGLVNAEAFGLAKIKLKQAKFEFEYTNEQFYPAAVLNGSITLTPKKDTSNSDSKSIASFGLEFERLRLTSKQPYLGIDDGGFIKMSGGGSMMSNFPVSISDVGFKKENGGQRIGIMLTLNVKLQKSGGDDSEGSNGFGGSAGFTIWTKRDPVVQKWKFDGVGIDRIVVEVDNSSFSLYGELNTFNDDEAYGTGFCGFLELKVVKKIEVKAAAIFGRKGDIDPAIPVSDGAMADTDSEYRYWFVDAAASFPVITVAPFVGVNAFTGGLYHNMKLDNKTTSSKSSVRCQTASGMTYTPDNSIFLGLMAGVGLQSVPSAAVFNGDITFGLEFNTSGGLNMVALWGGVTLLTPEYNMPSAGALAGKMEPKDTINEEEVKSKVPKEESGSLRVTWFTQYDVPNKTFIGDFDIYVNVLGIIEGSAEPSTKKAGHIAVMFSPDANYVYIGTPSTPVGLKVVQLFELTSYFCAGNTLPVPPIAPLPSQFNFSKVDYNALASGAGLSFGSRFHTGGKPGISFSALSCDLWVGAEVWVDAGFDVLISKSNQPINCSGYNPRGINNWYATGQAFIAGGMRVGVDYDCGVLGSGTKNLLSASLAAYVFAQLPRPTYLVGEISVEFTILKKDFSKSFAFEKGDQCSFRDQNKDIVFISSILPSDKSIDVKVTEKIEVNFANPIEKFEFSLPDEGSSSGGTKQYRAKVNESDVVVTANGKTIACSYKWNDPKTKLTLTPNVVLPENASIKVDVKVILEVNNGGWSASGKVETLSSTFTTQYEPRTIDVASIDYSYPLPDMKNYYRMESNAGYIKLGVLPLRPMRLASGYSYHVLFMDGSREVARVTDVTVNNNVGVEQFVFTIPNDKLSNEKKYTLKLVKAPSGTQKKEDAQEDYTVGYVNMPEDSVILQYDFTTSKFSSFAQKIAYYNQSAVEVSGASITESLTPNSKDISTNAAEGFTREETYGFEPKPGYKTSTQLIQAMGADFTSGIKINGPLPVNSIEYSGFGTKLVIQYNVLSEIDRINQDAKLQNIVCALDQSNAQIVNCTSAGSSGSFTFNSGTKLSYKMGYFLPGRSTKTSEVILTLTLPQPIELNY